MGPPTARSLVVACSFCRRLRPQGRRPWGTGGVAGGPGCFCRGVGGKLVKKGLVTVRDIYIERECAGMVKVVWGVR